MLTEKDKIIIIIDEKKKKNKMVDYLINSTLIAHAFEKVEGIGEFLNIPRKFFVFLPKSRIFKGIICDNWMAHRVPKNFPHVLSVFLLRFRIRFECSSVFYRFDVVRNVNNNTITIRKKTQKKSLLI